MNLQLHKNARTSPAIRRELQAQPASITYSVPAHCVPIRSHPLFQSERGIRAVGKGSGRKEPVGRLASASLTSNIFRGTETDEPSTPQKRTHLTGYPPRTTSPAGLYYQQRAGRPLSSQPPHGSQVAQASRYCRGISSRPHTIHANLSPAQEQITVALRTNLLLPLDDLLAVTHEFLNTTVSRSGLSRCLRRHNVSNLNVLREQIEPSVATAKPKPFKNYEPGFVHVDIKYLPKMPDEPRHKYLFAAIDRSTRWVYVEIHDNKSAQTANEFLSRLIDKAPFTINKILTDNGKDFTDRFRATGERQPTGRHPLIKRAKFTISCTASSNPGTRKPMA